MLPILRPERAALSGEDGLVRVLEAAAKSLGLAKSRADIRSAVQAGAAEVSALLAALAGAASPPDADDAGGGRTPRLVLAIDQGEELFLAEGAEEAAAFLDLVRDLATAPESNLIVLFTIRSDSFERLQTAPALEGLNPQTFSLPPMPRGAYQTVIEGPAKRLAESDRVLTVEPALTAALLADIEEGGGKDALPLLAFTLERLYVEYGGGGALTLAQYRELGGISGSIEAAVEGALKAAAGDPAVPRDHGGPSGAAPPGADPVARRHRPGDRLAAPARRPPVGDSGGGAAAGRASDRGAAAVDRRGAGDRRAHGGAGA